MRKRIWEDKYIWAVVVVILIGVMLLVFKFGYDTASATDTGANPGFWEEVDEVNPRGWDCVIYVNRGDHDSSLLWCDIPPGMRP